MSKAFFQNKFMLANNVTVCLKFLTTVEDAEGNGGAASWRADTQEF